MLDKDTEGNKSRSDLFSFFLRLKSRVSVNDPNTAILSQLNEKRQYWEEQLENVTPNARPTLSFEDDQNYYAANDHIDFFSAKCTRQREEIRQRIEALDSEIKSYAESVKATAC